MFDKLYILLEVVILETVMYRLLQHLKSELAREEERVHVLQQDMKARENDSAMLDELRAALDLERSQNGQLSDAIVQLHSDLTSEKARCDELARYANCSVVGTFLVHVVTYSLPQVTEVKDYK